MSDKPKLAFYWCASCGGCEESVVDLAEDILMVAGAVDIIFWPVAMDFKKNDVEAMEDGSIFAAMINGAIRTSEQEEMARLIRRKSKVVIAYGSCAHMGGIPSLANEFSREQIMEFMYQESPSVVNPEKIRPMLNFKHNSQNVNLPEIRNLVRTLDQVIDVDYYLPGCPPTPKLLKQAVLTLLSGEFPPKGTVLSPDEALCEECPRKESKPSDLSFKHFYRPHEVLLDKTKCLLSQGVVCMGPATRAGCEALCISGNMPCSGCFGPTSRVRDQGAKMLSSLCSNISENDEAGIDGVLDGIPDPVGTFYRYGLAASLLRKKITEDV
ncbi:MAG TPA: oxidoreductase [Ignavibacteria bacterium]|nr:oxidoreductase [Ignavibacteria bacterium]HRE09691.1 oxidoreductase [Ignavibacteria bacterium]HRF65581.1 oxidoreductase [Ignavibacteria bacterium]HRJ02923.1 oxidoreductase [Ignavibacteria bacterium]HRJ85271.1 oxidoreductase [Ignavibacteria bacterium]